MKFKNGYGQFSILIVCLFGILAAGSGSLLQAGSRETILTPKILIINSYHYGYRHSDEIAGTVYWKLWNHFKDADIQMEYMDAKRYEEPQDIKGFTRYLLEKYRKVTFDLIITLDDPAFRLIKEMQKRKWSHVPVVFSGLNDFSPAMLDGYPNYTGIIEVTDIKDNVRLIETLHPDATRLYLITDQTLTGTIARQKQGREIEHLTRMRVNYLDGGDLTLDNLLARLENLPEHSVVIYGHFLRDKNGKNYSHIKVLPLISEHCKAPVYGFWEILLGLGIVGGKLISSTEHGNLTADMAIRVLSGISPKDIPVNLESYCIYKFDHRQLKRFNINERLLPPGSVQIEQPESFFNRNRILILSILGILLVQFFISLIFLVQRLRRVKVEKALENENRLLTALMDNMPDHIYFKDTKSRFLRNNKAHLESFGLTRQEETLGKTDFDFFPKEFADQAFQDEQNIIRTGVPVINKLENTTRDPKNLQWFSSTKVPIRDEKGKITSLVGISRDITERILSTEQIEVSLKEKDVLLKEIHHRVKNNLQVISSLLNLQSSYINDPKTLDILRESQDRVRSMALIHENLYKGSDIAHLNLEDYIKTLVQSLKRSYQNHPVSVQFNLDIEDIPLAIDKAVPCGLIINELVSNALKHAFPDNRTGNLISISFQKTDSKDLCLTVRDNGQGMTEHFDWDKVSSLGLKLVRILAVEQLEGKIKLSGKKGTEIRICFPL